MITISIDLRKIDQSKCKTHENGAKYCDIILLESREKKFGNDYMVVQGLSKADRDAGLKGAILGNGKILQPAGQPRKSITTAPNTPARNADTEPLEDDSVPF